MVKLQYDMNEQYKITLPKQIMQAKGWKKGDAIRIELDDKGDIVLRRNENKKGRTTK